jgi:hypothetical protein
MKEPLMTALHPVDWEILNATADDCENLEQIYLSVCFELLEAAPDHLTHTYRRVRPAVLLQEVADRLRGLIERGLLRAVMDEDGGPPPDGLSGVWRAWFVMTPEGRRLWEAANPDEFVERK